MSLAYPPRFVKYLFASQKERDTARKSTPSPGNYGTFPAEIGLYFDSPGDDYLSQWFFLATNPGTDAGPESRRNLYTVTFHKGLSRGLTIYSSPERRTTPLAVASSGRPYVSSVRIRVASAENDDGRKFELEFDGISRDSYSFEFEGTVFVWTSAAMTRPTVRNLVQSKSGKSKTTSDDAVLATWTEGTVPNRKSRLATFRFVDPAARSQFGDCWALLAVTSALAICQQGVAVDGTMSWYEEKSLERAPDPV